MLTLTGRLEAFEERTEDLAASVEVAAVFGVDVSTTSLTFSNVEPGRTTVIGEGHDFNEVTCRSNAGRPWYVKAHVVSLTHLDRPSELPAAALKWKIVDVSGEGEPVGGSDFEAFTETPTLIYASRGDDDLGRPVVLHLQYSLTGPPDAPAGTYVGQIVVTMSEQP